MSTQAWQSQPAQPSSASQSPVAGSPGGHWMTPVSSAQVEDLSQSPFPVEPSVLPSSSPPTETSPQSAQPSSGSQGGQWSSPVVSPQAQDVCQSSLPTELSTLPPSSAPTMMAPQPAQPSTGNQFTTPGSEGEHWTPVASSHPTAIVPLRGPSSGTLDSTCSQVSQPPTPPPASSSQANSNPIISGPGAHSASSYPAPPAPYTVPRWQPPPIPAPTGPLPISAPIGPPGRGVGPAVPWISIRPIPPGSLGRPAITAAAGISTLPESSGNNVPAIPSSVLNSTSAAVAPRLTLPPTFASLSASLGSSGLPRPPGLPVTPGIPALSGRPVLPSPNLAMTAGFNSPSISSVPGVPSLSPGPFRSTPGPLGPSGMSGSFAQTGCRAPLPPPSLGTHTASTPTPEGSVATPVNSMTSLDSGGATQEAAEVPATPDSGTRPAMSLGMSSSVGSTTLVTQTASGVAPSSTLGSGVPPPMAPPKFGTYLSVPPVPQMLPWQAIPRPFFPLPMSVRPVIPPHGGTASRPHVAITSVSVHPGVAASSNVAVTKSSTDNTCALNACASSTSNGLATSTVGADAKSSVDKGASETLKDEITDAWTAHKTPEGTLYYYNSITGQSTYEKPPGFQGEVDKVAAQPTPVAWEMIGGTGWALVSTNDGKKYYYHTLTQASSWQIPSEVVDFRKQQSEDTSAKVSSGLGPSVKTPSDKGPVSFSLNLPNAGGREGSKVFLSATSSSALDLVKKKLQDSSMPGSGALVSNSESLGAIDTTNKIPVLELNKEKAVKSSSDSSSDSDDEDRGPTKDQRVTQFKEMLKEKGIVPFSKWEKELPKIIFDDRFKAIPSHTERRTIFDHYVRTRAEEERKEKRAAQKAAIENFKQLLEDASKEITHQTDYETFEKAWAGDPRFDALERKEREMLLNERVLPLRKAEEARVRAIHAAAVAGFNAMLKERGDITTSSRWSRIKDSMRNDPRYRAVKREDREALFHAYVAELQAAEQEAERLAKVKREEEEKLREREREARKRKEREEQEFERVRAKVCRDNAVNAYQALLTEKIKDPEASWSESWPKLEKDSLNRATNPELSSSDRERFFRDHVNALYERAVKEYRALLADMITVDAASKQNDEGKTILASWSEAKKLLKSDTRYSKMPRKDREFVWRRHAEDVQRRLKASGSTKDEQPQPPIEGSKGAILDSSKHSPGHRRSTRRR